MLIRVHRHQIFDASALHQTVRCRARADIDGRHAHGLRHRVHVLQRTLPVPQAPVGIALVDIVRHLRRSDSQQWQGKCR
ncbi:hypothetical protein D3C73_1520670 [compost metagenome]